jgi:uroporphyrinogen-III decarboxylase
VRDKRRRFRRLSQSTEKEDGTRLDTIFDMNHRERILATIRGEATDQIPWAPRMDLWQIAQRIRGTLPDRFVGKNTVEIAKELGVACHSMGGDYTQSGGADSSLRGFGLTNHRDHPFKVVLRDFPVETGGDGENSHTLIKTPVGDVTTHLYHSTQMRSDGISLPFFKSHAIESVDDFEAVALVFEHLEVIPTPEAYRSYHKRMGSQGVAVAMGLVAASPIHLMLHELIAMDKFFYFWEDERQAMRELAERMTPFYTAVLDVLADSDAEVVFWGANYDQDLTWPPFFAEEIVPWLKMASDRLHKAGELLLTHTDGENRDLLPLYRETGMDIADSVCPAPMTKCTLKEIREGMGDNITVWGGIPSIALLPSSMNDEEFDAHLDDLFGSLGSGGKLILGVSDNVPVDADLNRLEKIKNRVASFGPVNEPARQGTALP